MSILWEIETVDARRRMVGTIVLMCVVKCEGHLHHHPRDEDRGGRKPDKEHLPVARGGLRFAEQSKDGAEA